MFQFVWKCFCFAEGKWISPEWMQPLILSRFPLHKPASHSYWCSEASLHVTPARENGLSSPASWTWWTSQRGKSWRTLEDDWKADGWGRGPIPHGPLHRPPILIINHRPRFLIGLLGKPPPRPQRKRLFTTKFKIDWVGGESRSFSWNLRIMKNFHFVSLTLRH